MSSRLGLPAGQVGGHRLAPVGQPEHLEQLRGAPRGLAQAQAKEPHGGWKSRTVQQILTHPRTSGHAEYLGDIVLRNAYEPILPDDVREALITLFADPARKTSPGNTPKWLGSLIYRCGKCDDGTTMTVRRNTSGVSFQWGESVSMATTVASAIRACSA